jgi:hypothetical protein
MRIMETGARCAAAALSCLTVTGCQSLEASRVMNAELRGEVAATADQQHTSIVVVAIDRGAGKIVHRAFIANGQDFALRLAAGRYKVYAFDDQDHDGALGSGEPRSVVYALAASLRAGERRELPVLTIR